MDTMKSFRLELTEQEAEQLNALAIAHGNRLKPFAEYLLRLQIGTVKPPTVQPVVIPEQEQPVKEKPERETKPRKVKPLKVEPVKEKPQEEDQSEEPEEDEDIKYKFGMYSFNGEFFQTIQEAREAKRKCT